MLLITTFGSLIHAVGIGIALACLLFMKKSGDISEQGMEVGKVADLVLLENNPLEDIRHTRTIVGVMYNGHFFDQSKLAALETSVVNAASSIRVNIRYLRDLLMSPLMRMQLAD